MFSASYHVTKGIACVVQVGAGSLSASQTGVVPTQHNRTVTGGSYKLSAQAMARQWRGADALARDYLALSQVDKETLFSRLQFGRCVQTSVKSPPD